MKFTDLYIGEPGSLHDNRVLRRSGFYQKVAENANALYSTKNIYNWRFRVRKKNWNVVPFKNYGNLTQVEIDINFIHSSTRMVIEHSFIYLKGRFRRLHHFTEQTSLQLLVKKIIKSACILHNICLIQNDFFDIELPENPMDDMDDLVEDVTNPLDRRQELIQELLEKGVLKKTHMLCKHNNKDFI